MKNLKTNFSLFIHDSKFSYLDAVDFKPDESNDYVHHPINAFHMLQRLLDVIRLNLFFLKKTTENSLHTYKSINNWHVFKNY